MSNTNNLFDHLGDDEEKSVDSQSGDLSDLFETQSEVEREQVRAEEERQRELSRPGGHSVEVLTPALGSSVPNENPKP